MKDHVCEVCAKCKICVKPFPKKTENRSNGVLSLVDTDICGPMNKTSQEGARYFVTFIDDKSRYTYVSFPKTRDEILEKFKVFKAFAEKQTGRKIKCLRCDNGRKYLSGPLEQLLATNGIKRQYTVPHTPQQNGVAEREQNIG